mmetsp:Transcript_1530/g.2763  ORF Transcript_1530/g.2763 Transcript_1530/m.2763 type:complete len:416 (-) Transcript_1530:132-1379(-)
MELGHAVPHEDPRPGVVVDPVAVELALPAVLDQDPCRWVVRDVVGAERAKAPAVHVHPRRTAPGNRVVLQHRSSTGSDHDIRLVLDNGVVLQPPQSAVGRVHPRVRGPGDRVAVQHRVGLAQQHDASGRPRDHVLLEHSPAAVRHPHRRRPAAVDVIAQNVRARAASDADSRSPDAVHFVPDELPFAAVLHHYSLSVDVRPPRLRAEQHRVVAQPRGAVRRDDRGRVRVVPQRVPEEAAGPGCVHAHSARRAGAGGPGAIEQEVVHECRVRPGLRVHAHFRLGDAVAGERAAAAGLAVDGRDARAAEVVGLALGARPLGDAERDGGVREGVEPPAARGGGARDLDGGWGPFPGDGVPHETRMARGGRPHGRDVQGRRGLQHVAVVHTAGRPLDGQQSDGAVQDQRRAAAQDLQVC